MKPLLAVFLVLALHGAPLALAADVPTGAGTKALLFQFRGLSFLEADGYQGGLGLRLYTSDHWAVVPRVSLGVVSANQDFDGERFLEQRATAVGVGFAVERHWDASTSVLPYWGFGGEFDYARIKNISERVVVFPDAQARPSGDDERTDYRIGFFGSLGFEWGFAKKLSLGAEYRLGFGYFWGDQEYPVVGPSRSPSTVDHSGWGFDLQTFSLSLAVYLP